MFDSAYFVKSTPFKNFHLIFSALCRYVTDIMKICIKKFDAEKIFFDKLPGFLTQPFFQRLHLINNG